MPHLLRIADTTQRARRAATNAEPMHSTTVTMIASSPESWTVRSHRPVASSTWTPTHTVRSVAASSELKRTRTGTHDSTQVRRHVVSDPTRAAPATATDKCPVLERGRRWRARPDETCSRSGLRAIPGFRGQRAGVRPLNRATPSWLCLAAPLTVHAPQCRVGAAHSGVVPCGMARTLCGSRRTSTGSLPAYGYAWRQPRWPQALAFGLL